MRIALTETPGNPAHELRQQYQRLMAIEDTDELVGTASSLVRPLVGHGFSQKNHRKFARDISRARERGLVAVQSYLTNYLLAADGMAA